MAEKPLYRLDPDEQTDVEALLKDQFDAEAKVSAYIRYIIARRALPGDAFLNVSTMSFQPSLNPPSVPQAAGR